jgi:hypothetical protein
MNNHNPFQPPDNIEHDVLPVAKPKSALRWAWIGFVCGASLPVAYGVYGMQHHFVYIASLAPGEAACGMSALGSMAMIFVVGPICGMIGALASQVGWWILSSDYHD